MRGDSKVLREEALQGKVLLAEGTASAKAPSRGKSGTLEGPQAGRWGWSLGSRGEVRSQRLQGKLSQSPRGQAGRGHFRWG